MTEGRLKKFYDLVSEMTKKVTRVGQNPPMRTELSGKNEGNSKKNIDKGTACVRKKIKGEWVSPESSTQKNLNKC